jgi:8-amino-7-oxononanoate synthase
MKESPSSLDAFARHKLVNLEETHLRRQLTETTRTGAPFVTRRERSLISFSCNDYLGLSQHPKVKAAARAAIETYGAGAGASRLITGSHPLLAELENKLARLKGTEAACVFGSGYLANLGIIPALAGDGDLILVDELAHACIFGGARLSSASVKAFPHNDVAHVAAILKAERRRYRRALLVTDTVFSMDGDRAPIADLALICDAHDVWLMTDDAHGLGMLPRNDAQTRVPLQMGTLSKALGSYGGYLCASRAVIDLLTSRARTLVYSTALPPASAAAAIAALDIITADPELCARPLAKARDFAQRLDLTIAQSPIVPLVLGDATAALRAARELEHEGFLVVAIRPPTVPEGSARLRFAFSATHRDEDVARLAAAVSRLDIPAAI